ncbi:ribosomal protein S6 kinase alpha-4-like [Varroa jacobsoni]|uniref:Protein kinase domain-containing protein n=1 Tax=Varroa destructor TaxID=109461 RepID=A0A7M7J872_VARDE|nr:ribosomal protein S6 kinase alpha-4-like isoform X2 [Varroa destructor]XP_022711767.1 ribosomal protein S6 kinase alpha-4-like [Varroa jacobsoni]
MIMVLTCQVYYRTKDLEVFICEYFNGSLLSEVLAEGVIQPHVAMKIISQVAFAICSIHNMGMIFRGVAPQNILVDAEGNIRLFDFQFATDKEWSFYPTGFLPYMAPEMIEGKKSYGPEVDYWALGILMYELTVRHSPLSVFCRIVGLEDIRDPEYSMLLLDHMPIRLPGNIDPNARALMRELLHDNPRLRIGCRRRGFEELKNHPYFDGVAWETYLVSPGKTNAFNKTL